MSGIKQLLETKLEVNSFINVDKDFQQNIGSRDGSIFKNFKPIKMGVKKIYSIDYGYEIMVAGSKMVSMCSESNPQVIVETIGDLVDAGLKFEFNEEFAKKVGYTGYDAIMKLKNFGLNK